MTWKNGLQLCFGTADSRFALHPDDKKRALELLDVLTSKNVTLRDVENEIRTHISHCQPDHINEQIQKARSLYGGWLS